MITLFTIGILFLVFEMIALALRATWGLMKAVFWVLGLPFVLVAMLLGGLLHLAMPLLIIGLIIGLFSLGGKHAFRYSGFSGNFFPETSDAANLFLGY